MVPLAPFPAEARQDPPLARRRRRRRNGALLLASAVAAVVAACASALARGSSFASDLALAVAAASEGEGEGASAAVAEAPSAGALVHGDRFLKRHQEHRGGVGDDAVPSADDAEAAAHAQRRVLLAPALLAELQPPPTWRGLLLSFGNLLRWRESRLLVPMEPAVARWWDMSSRDDFLVRLQPCPTGSAHLHLQVIGRSPLLVSDQEEVRGVFATVAVPRGALLRVCTAAWTTIDLEPLDGGSARPRRALRLTCPVVPTGSSWPATLGRVLFLMLLPFLLAPGTVAQSPVLLLILIFCATFACTCLILLLVILLKARLTRFVLRRRRLLQLRKLQRGATSVEWAYCEGEPCCICLGELPSPCAASDEQPALPAWSTSALVLLPCRHALHADCYSEWVGTAVYRSQGLRCPLCGSDVSAAGRLSRSPSAGV
eukprot:TRINITY_DN49213_c0_g1_i1.p1 TRINITY_DN49213_c0_g1~~TRINITY_DN49213_c0_g1_i1.p1  ORF type:complete len:460 (-),score=78.98 TRINITY_DN49213_c0_g1_i1:62-1351(-)